MKKEFIKFLKSKRLFSKFRREFEKDNWNNDLSVFFRIEDAEDYIDLAFIWTHTENGRRYWIDISDQWQKHLKTLK